MPVASVAVSHGSSSGCAVRLTAAELAELARGSEAALRRGLEACHQSFLQHQRQQHSASAAAQAQSRQPVLLGPSSAASSVPCCGVSRGDSFPLARVSTHSSSGGQWSSTCGRCVVTGSSGSFEVASCGSAGCERIYAAGGRGSSYSSPMPVAPPTPPQLYDLANAPRECILLTCRGLCLSADTTGRLALHIWTRVASLARLLLSVRPATAATAAASTAYGGTGAAGAAAGLQVFAVAAVWVAAKLEERRQEVPGSGALAVAARSSPAALAAAELRILQWCDWSPYAGFVPDESYLLTWGP
ncbi:hypothetical protein HXX76_010171 [Chlamydomonas incerta]|uniref:Uncharacterized protein n=1 Tax=Chlamydomonas incerta TaxID=51695 RepID=A0A835T1Y1_CHLIN|nr:hypothetical protein HXX76_010170 [Chlamydomonas incerta]KAG2430071.1 hypothetical protein HXX76_010171 [Chlamydomonas incerta]|eukprot:KAG2430070.1 hypothetical protein HXX76_010170 [Chlamydomonas incerta]